MVHWWVLVHCGHGERESGDCQACLLLLVGIRLVRLLLGVYAQMYLGSWDSNWPCGEGGKSHQAVSVTPSWNWSANSYGHVMGSLTFYSRVSCQWGDDHYHCVVFQWSCESQRPVDLQFVGARAPCRHGIGLSQCCEILLVLGLLCHEYNLELDTMVIGSERQGELVKLYGSSVKKTFNSSDVLLPCPASISTCQWMSSYWTHSELQQVLNNLPTLL
jgi:hypothetical protein